MTRLSHRKQVAILNADSSHLTQLVQFALNQGASDAKAIAACDIVVEDRLAELCHTPGCPNYGLSPSCPPHVSGPAGFRELKRQMPWAVVVRLVVPLAALFSSEKRELSNFLHTLVAAVEGHAVDMGYAGSKAFAGGSCKSVFCHEHPTCQRLSDGLCRHVEYARPSMSGFGINVSELMKTCGWPSELSGQDASLTEESMSWLAGLVLVG